MDDDEIVKGGLITRSSDAWQHGLKPKDRALVEMMKVNSETIKTLIDSFSSMGVTSPQPNSRN